MEGGGGEVGWPKKWQEMPYSNETALLKCLLGPSRMKTLAPVFRG